MAVEDSRLTIAPHSALWTGILIGSGRGNVTTVEQNMTSYLICKENIHPRCKLTGDSIMGC